MTIKKIVLTLILAGLIFIPAFSAYADVLVEPNNDFYNKNRRYVVQLDRSFSVNAPRGFAVMKEEPGARGEITRIGNGETIFVNNSCLYNGEYWGLTTGYPVPEQGRSADGWIRMDDLLVLYDYIAFAEEHFNEFYDYKGDFEEIERAGAAVVWPWPGAEAPIWKVEELDTEYFGVSFAYTDESGREWGFVTYLYGSRNIWICLSDPLNPDISVFNPAPPPMEWSSDTEHTNIVGDESDIPVLIIVLVAAVVLVTLVLIKVFWKKT